MPKIALITGVTGQDGSYLAELLLAKGYEVHGVKRRSSSFNTERVDHIFEEITDPHRRFTLHYGDLTDSANMIKIVAQIRPDEIYNLGAQSHVKVSFDIPEYTANTDGIGTLRMLEAIKTNGLEKTCRFYQASTSEMFGGVGYNMPDTGYTEDSPFHPRSPYGAAKLYAHWITRNYRESYQMFACSGILFNHESPRRGETFVTRKITRAVAHIKLGSATHVSLGNLNALRDWGHARDYVEGMWLMLQANTPDDYILASGQAYSVRQFAELAFAQVGMQIEWRGEGLEEKGYDKQTGQMVVNVDSRYFRPAEVDFLLGDPSKARTQLNWTPRYSLEAMVAEMVQADLALHRRELILKHADPR